MEKRAKKVLAREFLLSMLCLVVYILAFISTIPLNSLRESEIEHLKQIRTNKIDEFNELLPTFIGKLASHNQYKYGIENLDEYKMDGSGYFLPINSVPVEFMGDHEVSWDMLVHLQKGDSIIYKWTYDWNLAEKQNIRENVLDVEINNGYDLDRYIAEKRFSAIELNNKLQADSLKSEIQSLSSKISYEKQRKFDSNESSDFALFFLLLSIIIVFLFRYLYYALRWSIRTLKS